MTRPACILLDIEGTTSSISFVFDVMFPYVRDNLESYLEKNWGDPNLVSCLELLANDTGHDRADLWLDANPESAKKQVVGTVLALMDNDVKATGLKQLQGMIWKNGFETGALVAHLFPDVAPSLFAWYGDGIQIRIYSSGSVDAQRLFFGHTEQGDLLHLLSGHYDTKTGPKREAASYRKIVMDIGLPADQVLFVSDVPAELDAAAAAGIATCLSIRPGNHECDPAGHRVISQFDEVVDLDQAQSPTTCE